MEYVFIICLGAWSMEIIVTAVLPNVVLNRCVTNALDYSLRR